MGPKSSLVLFVDPAIQITHEGIQANSKGVANPEEGGDRDRPTCLNLLPMPRRKSEPYHVLLSIFALFAQRAYALAKCAKKTCFVNHTSTCRMLRAETPRAE
jgi:hypothetical protein